MEWIEAGKEEAQRVRGRLQIDIIDGVTNEEGRVVDHDEVLRRRRTLRHARQLDRHAATIAARVLLRSARAVRKSYPCGKGARLREHADTQYRRQIIQHPEFGVHAAMRLGVRVSARGSVRRRGADLTLDDAYDRRDRIGFSRRYGFAGAASDASTASAVSWPRVATECHSNCRHARSRHGRCGRRELVGCVGSAVRINRGDHLVFKTRSGWTIQTAESRMVRINKTKWLANLIRRNNPR